MVNTSVPRAALLLAARAGADWHPSYLRLRSQSADRLSVNLRTHGQPTARLPVAHFLIPLLVCLASAQAYDEAPVVKGGSISGVVFFDGAPPERKPLDVKAPCHDKALSEDVMVNKSKDGTKNVVENVVVSIVEIDKGKPFSKEVPVLDQKGCVFAPHIVIVPAPGTLKVLNTDDTIHNIHTMTDLNKEVNRTVEPEGSTTLKFEEPERIALRCDVHRWMKSWIIVAANPYIAVTDKEGAFKITDVPPGTYTLSFWHETLGEQKKQVTVKAEEEAKAECTCTVKK